MYKQRIMPLVLAFALCSTSVSAMDGRRPSWFEHAFYAAGTACFVLWGWFAWKSVRTIPKLQAQLDLTIPEVQEQHKKNNAYLKDRMVFEQDLKKINIAVLLRKKDLSLGDLNALQLSPDFNDLMKDVQQKLKL